STRNSQNSQKTLASARSAGSAFNVVSRSCLWSSWRAFAVLFLAAAQRYQSLSLVQPHLDANLPVGRIGFSKAVIDIRAERLQRQLTVEIPLGPRDFRAVQPT